jgi:hypothetical protein
MLPDWLDELNIPSTATTLWFELLDTPTDDSISMDATIYSDSIDFEVGSNYSGLYVDEFRKGDFQKILNAFPLLEDGISFGRNEKIHLQVHFK